MVAQQRSSNNNSSQCMEELIAFEFPKSIPGLLRYKGLKWDNLKNVLHFCDFLQKLYRKLYSFEKTKMFLNVYDQSLPIHSPVKGINYGDN